MSIPPSKTSPMFCSSNILCQEIFSSELSFVQHRKQLLSKLICLKGFLTLTDFQFMFLSIDIIHLTRIKPSRKKNEAKRKSSTFSFNFTFIVEQTLLKTCPRTHYYSAKFPQTHYFYSFFVGILPRTSKCPITPLFFIIFARKYATVHFASNKSKYVFHD